jgi:hypothetical protein
VCKLDSWTHILWVLRLALKPGMTEWYQSRVDRRNASLVRRVVFQRLFYNQTIFTPSLFKISSLLLMLSTILLFFALLLWRKVLPTFSKSSQKIWHLQVYIFASKHLDEVWRCIEGPTNGEASLSSRLEDTFGWRDGIFTPSSPPYKMATCAPHVYVIPYNDDD